MWEKNIIDIPSNIPKLITESEINLEPTVSHHTRKKGLSIVKINPARIGFLILNLEFEITWELVDLFLRMEIICKIENNNRKIPPIKPMNLNITSDKCKVYENE